MNNILAKKNIIHFIYLIDKPNFDGDELLVSSDFGFLSAVGNTNTLITVAKMNASQELTALSYQTIGDAIYKQSQQQINGEKRSQASAQKILLSEQFDYKLTEPDDRLFIYAEY